MAAPLRALLVGCGGICRAWLNSTKDRSDVQIVGLVDLNPANAEKIVCTERSIGWFTNAAPAVPATAPMNT